MDVELVDMIVRGARQMLVGRKTAESKRTNVVVNMRNIKDGHKMITETLKEECERQIVVIQRCVVIGQWLNIANTTIIGIHIFNVETSGEAIGEGITEES